MTLEERIALIEQTATEPERKLRITPLIIEAEKLEADIQSGKDVIAEQDQIMAKLRGLAIFEWQGMSWTLRKKTRPMSMLTKDEKIAVLRQDLSARTGTSFAQAADLRSGAKTPSTFADHIVTTSKDLRGGRFAVKQVEVWKPTHWAEADCGVAPPLGYNINDVPDMTTVDGSPRAEPIPEPVVELPKNVEPEELTAQGFRRRRF
jgi:hypothetical protein